MPKAIVILFLASLSISALSQAPYILILGTAQDGGFPHIGCSKTCCAIANDSLREPVVSFALVNPSEKKWWLFEATPDMPQQLRLFQKLTDKEYGFLPDGIFLTHAHIGHYTGLMYLGREALGANRIPVYTLPRMQDYLKNNGPWSQLVKLNNIEIRALHNDTAFAIATDISVTAFTVPHRDEYSETAGFKISSPNRRYLFIPDIDKWEKWSRKIENEVAEVDIALLDATFYQSTELPNRDIKEIPHPMVTETMGLLEKQKQKIYFIHFNHTNPLLWNRSEQQNFNKSGFSLARKGMKL